MTEVIEAKAVSSAASVDGCAATADGRTGNVAAGRTGDAAVSKTACAAEVSKPVIEMASGPNSMTERATLKAQADSLHRQGYNCAQAVICTLAPQLGIDADAAFRLAEGFGAGMGGMSETCGAISGAIMAAGQATSAGTADPTSKGRTYQLSREIVRLFREKNGSTICRELKGIGSGAGPLRTCPGCIDDAIDIALDVLAR